MSQVYSWVFCTISTDFTDLGHLMSIFGMEETSRYELLGFACLTIQNGHFDIIIVISGCWF